MKLAARLCVFCIAAAALPLAGCSTGLSEAKVQAMIDKAIERRMGRQGEQASAPAEVEESASGFTPETPGPAFASERNEAVDNQLNNADMAFRKGWEDNGCFAVGYAISAGARSSITEDQSRQLSSYAARCKLRY